MLHLLDIVHCHKQLISIMFLSLRMAREPASKTLKSLVISRLFRCSGTEKNCKNYHESQSKGFLLGNVQ